MGDGAALNLCIHGTPARDYDGGGGGGGGGGSGGGAVKGAHTPRLTTNNRRNRPPRPESDSHRPSPQ